MKIAANAGRIARRGAAFGLLLLLAGCAEELGPEPMPTAPVAGVVVRGGRPLSRGWLEFTPVDGTVGRLRSARIGPDGRFRGDRVPVGTVGVRLVGGDLLPEERLPLGQIYLIRLDVPPEGADGVVIDLERELREIAARRSS